MYQRLKKLFHWLAAPANYSRFSGGVFVYATAVGLLLYVIGAWLGLAVAPDDYQQGDVFRIMYVHVPAAWLSLMIYSWMTVCAVIVLVWRLKICEHLMLNAAPIGAWITFMALATGSIWGKPTWGTWWVWGDARLTSELVLLFIYLGIIGVARAMSDARVGARAAALLTVVGVVNLPIIHFSVVWWSSLHQGDSVNMAGKLTIDMQMLWPLLLMTLAYMCLFVAVWHLRVQASLAAAAPGQLRPKATKITP